MGWLREHKTNFRKDFVAPGKNSSKGRSPDQKPGFSGGSWATGGNFELGISMVVSLNLPQSSSPYGSCISLDVKVCVELKEMLHKSIMCFYMES